MDKETKIMKWYTIVLLIIFMALLAKGVKGQSKKDLVMYGSQFIAGSWDGVNQSITAYHITGNKFWNHKVSWKNKYRDYDRGNKRAAYLGSKGIFIAGTDGFHLTRALNRSFQTVSLAIALSEHNTLKQIVKKIIVSVISNRAGFILFYNVIYP